MPPQMPERFPCPYCRSWSGLGINYLPHMQVYVCYACAQANKLRPISEAELTNKSEAPWTEDQVASLSAYQGCPQYFPFVCRHGDIMVATRVGLFCPGCEQILKWAYDWTLDWSWKALCD